MTSRIGQVLDEIPMVWGNSAFIYACITLEDKPGETVNAQAISRCEMSTFSTFRRLIDLL